MGIMSRRVLRTSPPLPRIPTSRKTNKNRRTVDHSFILLGVRHHKGGPKALAEHVHVIHLLGPYRKPGKLAFTDGLGRIGEAVVARSQPVRIEPDSVVFQLFVVKAPSSRTEFMPRFSAVGSSGLGPVCIGKGGGMNSVREDGAFTTKS